MLLQHCVCEKCKGGWSVWWIFDEVSGKQGKSTEEEDNNLTISKEQDVKRASTKEGRDVGFSLSCSFGFEEPCSVDDAWLGGAEWYVAWRLVWGFETFFGKS